MSDLPIVDEASVHIEKIAKAIHKRCKQLNVQDEFQLENQEQQFLDIIENRTLEAATQFDKPVVLVVTTSKTEAQYKETEEYKTIEKQIYINTIHRDGAIKTPLSLEIVSDNAVGLSEVYNRFITEEFDDSYVCFIQDDVKITDVDFFNKIQEAHRNAEIVGVAGATKIQIPFALNQPTLWTALSTFADPKTGKPSINQSGSVTHKHNGSYWSADYGNSPQTCRLIDGVLMSFDVSKCVKYGFKFDERFTFHHFDLSACLVAAKCGLNITSWPISIQQASVSDYRNEAWKASHIKFVQVYKNFSV